jgi:hypothetical protein
MKPRTLEDLLERRLEMIAERDQLRERLQLITHEIDAAMQEREADRLLSQLTPRQRDILVQEIKARGIKSEEKVNG